MSVSQCSAAVFFWIKKSTTTKVLVKKNLLLAQISILKLWQARSYDKGSKIHIFNNKREIKTGTFLGLDEIGGLILGEDTGVKKIYSGDVYFGS